MMMQMTDYGMKILGNFHLFHLTTFDPSRENVTEDNAAQEVKRDKVHAYLQIREGKILVQNGVL